MDLKSLHRRLAMLFVGLVSALAMHVSAADSKVTKTTFTYSVSPELKLDRYETASDSSRGRRPAIIFAFGGGFTHGTRDDARYLDYFNFMARQGYVVVSIDYRTTLAGFNPSTPKALNRFGEALVLAIKTATADYLTATAFVIAHSDEWNINPAMIIASGSSAGAITALQAEYTLVTDRPAAFPPQFNYAAAVTFAGAILSQGAPTIADNLCPVMLFQGDADRQVPYNSLVLGPIGLYGSEFIATAVRNGGGAGAFWTELGAGHEIALSPMENNLYDIAGFLDHVLSGSRKEFSWTTVTVPGRGAYQKDFSIKDYIKANMPE